MYMLGRRSPFVLFLGLIIACTLSFTDATCAQELQQSSASARIAGLIDDSSTVSLRGNTHPQAQPRFDRGPAPLTMPAERLMLVLSRSAQQQASLETYLQSVQDANSPDYHRFVSPEEFGRRFGVGASDLEAIVGWLTGHGFSVSAVAEGRMAIEFSGTVGQVQSAFHTSLHSYVVNGEQHWANATDPQIPSALAPVVAGVASLHSFKPIAQSILGPTGSYDAQKRTITPTYTIGDATKGYYIFLGPADAATIYNTPTTGPA